MLGPPSPPPGCRSGRSPRCATNQPPGRICVHLCSYLSSWELLALAVVWPCESLTVVDALPQALIQPSTLILAESLGIPALQVSVETKAAIACAGQQSWFAADRETAATPRPVRLYATAFLNLDGFSMCRMAQCSILCRSMQVLRGFSTGGVAASVLSDLRYSVGCARRTTNAIRASGALRKT